MKHRVKTFYKLEQFTASVGKKINFKLATNGIKLKADRLYKRLVCGGLILGCVIGMYFKNKKR